MFVRNEKVEYCSAAGNVGTGIVGKAYVNWGAERMEYEVYTDKGTVISLPPERMRALALLSKQELKLRGSVKGKLAAEGLSIESKWENIVDCLGKTVAPSACIACAAELRFMHLEEASA